MGNRPTLFLFFRVSGNLSTNSENKYCISCLLLFPPGGATAPETTWLISGGRFLPANQIAGYSSPDQSPVAVDGPLWKMHLVMRGARRGCRWGGGGWGFGTRLVCVGSPKLCRLVVNMMSVCCFLALGLFSCALCRDGEEALQPDFRSDEHTLSLNKSEVWKRSAGLNEQTCTGFPGGVESTLPNNTHTVSHYFTFSNRNYSIKLWENEIKWVCVWSTVGVDFSQSEAHVTYSLSPASKTSSYISHSQTQKF